MFRLFLFSLSFLFLRFCLAQAPIGNWTYYGSYNNMEVLEHVGSKTYVANDQGAFFVTNTATNETTKLTKLDGFIDSKVSYLRYSESEQILVIAYSNGQIDLLKGNQILNVNDIFRNENISTSKRINHITIRLKEAYLSTDFGIVVLDITTGLIKETYRYIGGTGNQVEVYSSTINKTDSLFIVTEEGVQAASLLNSNLQDFNNWDLYDVSNQLPTEDLVDVCTLNDTVYLASVDGVYMLKNQSWENKILVTNTINSMTENDQNLMFCYADTVATIHSSESITYSSSSLLTKANMARLDNQGAIQLTDEVNSLVKLSPQQVFSPSGPRYSDAFRIRYFDEKITVLSGGYTNFNSPNNTMHGYYEYKGLDWTSFEPGEELPLVDDLVSVAYNSITKLTYYASFGDGLLVKEGDTYQLFNDTNSLLDTAADGKVYIADIQIDDAGNTWLTNYNVTGSGAYLYKVDLEGTWSAYRAPNTAGRYGLEFVIDQSEYKWIQVRSGGSVRNLLVYDPESGSQQLLTTSSGLPDAVNCLDVNTKGEIYIGTSDGVAIVYNPQNVFTNGATVTRPVFGDSYLLQEESINAIKVDGGDRMWVGTDQGLYLYNEDFSEQLAFFNKNNSPLLQNKILALEINGETGELFVSTEDGVFSYMGDATEATSVNKSNILIYPNPVLPEYEGVVAIRGLVRDANVKITDINTNLVYETNAEGGTATWDMNLLSGERATTGVYLVFTSDEEGNETFIGKIAVISQ